MRHCLFALAFVVSLPLFAADPPKAEPPKAPTFAGEWQSTFGPMTLTEKDGKVTGFYQMGSEKSEISGTVKDRKLTFTYKEAVATGEGEFELAADGLSFTGKWRQTGDQQWGLWKGTRPKAKDFSGLWRSASGPMRLTQTGDKVRGQYLWEGSAGGIEGTVKGKTLTFTYREPGPVKDGKPTDITGGGTFTLADDADSFTGKWKTDTATALQEWPTNKRVVAKPGKQWLVIVEANWEGSLSEPEYSFGSMLKAFFAGSEEVGVRHRMFTDADSMTRWLKEVAFLAEPVVVVLSSHGSAEGPNAEKGPPTAKAIAEALRGASNVRLLHFAACEVMRGKFGEQVQKELGADATFPVSGYTTNVDWAGSAVSEFLFYDFLLRRGMDPEQAMAQLIKAMPYVGDKAPKDSPIAALGMKLRPSPLVQKGIER
jgi:hypothetical protein